MITGKRLLAAAETVYKAGHQIDKMMEFLEDETCLFIDKEENLFTNIEKTKGELLNANDWISCCYILNIPISTSPRKNTKPSSWLGYMITIYDERDSEIFKNWEPSLYVMYGPGISDEEWEAGSFADEIIKNEWKLRKDGRLWISASDEKDTNHFDCWFFALPVTELNNEESLRKFVIEPAIKLIKMNKDNYKDINLKMAFPEESPAFSFEKDGDNFRMIRSC